MLHFDASIFELVLRARATNRGLLGAVFAVRIHVFLAGPFRGAPSSSRRGSLRPFKFVFVPLACLLGRLCKNDDFFFLRIEVLFLPLDLEPVQELKLGHVSHYEVDMVLFVEVQLEVFKIRHGPLNLHYSERNVFKDIVS